MAELEPQPNSSELETQSNIVDAPDGSVVKLGSLYSANYSPGIAGWIIKANGDAELNDGVFRGDITASSGTITGGIVVGTNGYIRSGQTAYNTGTGWWIGNDGGTSKFSFGSSSGNRVTWDGSTLTIIGTPAPTRQTFTTSSSALGDTTSRFDVTNPAGTTYRYTYDGTGTDPGITAAVLPVGIPVLVESTDLNTNNTGFFIVTGSGANYFEVTNASGVAENDKTLGSGYLKKVIAQTYTKPANVQKIEVEIQGAGAGGRGLGANANNGANGGGAGAYMKKLYAAASIGATETLYVGPGGVSFAHASLIKVAGSSALFGSLLTAPGGSSTDGATASGGDLNISGEDGSAGTATAVLSGRGGSSFLGSGGPGRVADNSGADGKGFGGGGSGAFGDASSSAAAGGSGAPAIIIVNEYY